MCLTMTSLVNKGGLVRLTFTGVYVYIQTVETTTNTNS